MQVDMSLGGSSHYSTYMSVSLDIFPDERDPRQMSGTVGRVGSRLIGCGARKDRIGQAMSIFTLKFERGEREAYRKVIVGFSRIKGNRNELAALYVNHSSIRPSPSFISY